MDRKPQPDVEWRRAFLEHYTRESDLVEILAHAATEDWPGILAAWCDAATTELEQRAMGHNDRAISK